MKVSTHSFASRCVWCSLIKVVYHNVLKPKPTIHHVCHALDKTRRARANVQNKDNDSEASMQYSVNNEDFDDPGVPNDYLNPNSSSMKMIA